MVYRIFDLNSSVNTKEWDPFFSKCPKDPYVMEGFRYKSISWHEGKYNDFRVLPHAPLFQDKKINNVHGNIIRNYPAIESELFKRSDYHSLLNIFSNACRLKGTEIILVQLQRIDCNSFKEGLPAIEGFHRDGIDWLGVFVISRTNIIGAETQIKDKFGKIILSKTIDEGNLLLIDDTKVFHYSTPIRPKENADYGFRDVVLITACSKKLMGGKEMREK